MDDALYSIPISVIAKSKQTDDTSWEKENEKMRKKLERNSLNSVKFKYAQIQQQQLMSPKPEDADLTDLKGLNTQGVQLPLQ